MYIKVSIPEHFQLKIMPSLYSLMFRRENDVHYIGGAEVLPAPLDAKREAECIENLGEEDGEARKCLIEHNLRLVVYIAKKFDNTGIGVEDLISIGTIGLIKAINTFNPGKNIKLATYASRCTCGAAARQNWRFRSMSRSTWTGMETSFCFPISLEQMRILFRRILKMRWSGNCSEKRSKNFRGESA